MDEVATATPNWWSCWRRVARCGGRMWVEVAKQRRWWGWLEAVVTTVVQQAAELGLAGHGVIQPLRAKPK